MCGLSSSLQTLDVFPSPRSSWYFISAPHIHTSTITLSEGGVLLIAQVCRTLVRTDDHLSETLLRDMHFLFPKDTTQPSLDGSSNDLSMAQKMMLLDLVDATHGEILGELAQRLTECPV
jgi:hypothetical protein